MPDHPLSTLLDEALEAWSYMRDGVLEEAGVIPDERYDWRPHPEARSAGEILRHILESGRMAVGELTREDGDFTRQSFGEFMEEYAGDLPDEMDPGELRDRLRSSLDEGVEAFREAGELHILGSIRRFDGRLGTRLAWLHHHVAHESHHRGQVALYARQMDITPALTRRIRGE